MIGLNALNSWLNTFLSVRGVNYSLRVTPAVNRSTIITPRIAIGGDSQVIIQTGGEFLQLKSQSTP